MVLLAGAARVPSQEPTSGAGCNNNRVQAREIAHVAHTCRRSPERLTVCLPRQRRVLPVRIRTLWRRLWEVPDVVRSPNAECPLCGAGVVVEPNAYAGVTLGCGSVLSPRPRQELIGACAKHGRSPYNDKTVKYNAQAATATGGALDE
jgi:hypothetical protein